MGRANNPQGFLEDYKEIKGVRYPFDERVIIKEILDEIK